MTEQVTITPLGGQNTDGDPLPDGTPFPLRGLVTPGNTTRRPGESGDLDTADFTVYLPLRMRLESEVPGVWEWVSVGDLLTEDFRITVRGRECVGRAQVWEEGGRGGIAVLATSATGTSA